MNSKQGPRKAGMRKPVNGASRRRESVGVQMAAQEAAQ